MSTIKIKLDKSGVVDSPLDLRDYRSSKVALYKAPPEEFQLQPKTILNQGQVGSCVAHATASYMEQVKNNLFSTGFIYGYRPSNYYQGIGMMPRDAMKTINSVGNVYHHVFPENVEYPTAKQMVDNRIDYLIASASNNKSASYARLKVGEIKSWIYNNKYPVLFTCDIGNATVIDNRIYPPAEYVDSGHAMLIIGWNKNGWIIQNSWGTSFCNNGIGVLDYSYQLKEIWGITFNDELVRKPFAFKLREQLQKIVNFFRKLF